MFIEPGVVFKDELGVTKKRFPDLLICNTREIIGVVELKYMPRVKPDYKKDLETLVWMAGLGENISVSNSRFRGLNVDSQKYSLSETALWVWAGIHADVGVGIAVPESLGSNFLDLHAITQPDGEAVIKVGRKTIQRAALSCPSDNPA